MIAYRRLVNQTRSSCAVDGKLRLELGSKPAPQKSSRDPSPWGHEPSAVLLGQLLRPNHGHVAAHRHLHDVVDSLGMNGHRNFYVLRHAHRTVADEARDQPAADHLMGHESAHMSTLCREKISDKRLKAVVNHVHAWLFAGA